MKDLIFAILLGTGEAENDALRLARSIRTFGGEFCFNPIWLLSQMRAEELSEATRQELFPIGVRLITFDINAAGSEFPFAAYVMAAGLAEGLAQGETSCLVMLAADTLILQPPRELLLSPGKSFGGGPVHLKLLGSRFSDPIDDFWELIYHSCKVDQERIFSMQTVVDEQLVRAYFNAGLLVVRPERGILRSWQSDFENLYRLPEFEQFYQLSDLYKIFMHQAVLAGSVLSSLKPGDIQQFPFETNYPLHLHSRVPVRRRPTNLNQLVSCRFEDFNQVFINQDADGLIQIDKPLKDWLQAQVKWR